MAYNKTVWVDRSTELEDTFTLVTNPDSSVTLTEITGDVYAEGTPINASNMNKLEVGVESSVEKASVVNNVVTTATGTVLDGRVGKFLQDEVDTLNTSLNAEIDKTVYSTAEKRIGTWTDGKPIYRIRIYGFSITVSNTSWTSIVSSESMNISTLVRGDLFGLNILNACAVRDQDGYIKAQCLFNGGVFGGADSLVLEYTKTTD